jgi:hypothetical protein
VIPVLIVFTGLSENNAYQLMSKIITHRPIAWASMVPSSGVTNFAPLSFSRGYISPFYSPVYSSKRLS